MECGRSCATTAAACACAPAPGRDCTAEFPELAAIAGVLGRRRVILDGELVCLDHEGRPDFAALRARLGRHPRSGDRSVRIAPVMLMVFDVLHSDGWAVRRLPYARRRELLGELELEGPAWRTPRHFSGEHEALLAATAEQGLEGVVAKTRGRPLPGGPAQRGAGEDQAPPPRCASHGVEVLVDAHGSPSGLGFRPQVCGIQRSALVAVRVSLDSQDPLLGG